MSDAGQPASPPQTLGLPSNPQLIPFEKFDTLNTKPLRPGIGDQEMYWCDGWIPLGPNNLRTLYGVGPKIYTAPGGLTIVFFAFGNIQSTSYCYVELSDGSIVQVDINSMSTTAVAPAGTIINPTPIIGFNQWGSKYIAFSANQTNGYWLWDGSHLFTAGAIGPTITLTDSGIKYTSAPTVTFTTTGSGAGVVLTAVVENGSVVRVDVTNPGSGFAVDDFTLLTFTGGGSDDTATAHVTINASSGPLSGAFVTNGGSQYASTDHLTLSGGGGSGGALQLNLGGGGVVTGITVISPGSGYTSEPAIIFHTSTGSGAAAFVTISTGSIASVTIDAGGTGYTSPPQITIIGDGKNAVVQAHIDDTGTVTSADVLNGGDGYTSALVRFTLGNNAATATAQLMPFGVSGTTMETYQNRMWVGSISDNIPKGLFTAPSDPANFNDADGGGAFPSNDSFLRVQYQCFKQSNGFLYLMADSSINYISGVNTSGDPAVTTFNNLNVDPQIGTPWPGSVQVFSRNIVFANSLGVYVSYGGAVTKISEQLDGIFNSVVSTDGITPNGFYPSSAVANIFGREVYMLLMPIVDSYTGQTVNKLLMWDGKRWFTSPQDVTLTYISEDEINSVLTAYGTNGTDIYPLFQQPTLAFQKVVQSKLWATPHYVYRKVSRDILGILNFYDATGTVTVALDNETGSSSVTAAVASAQLTWTNNSGQPITWTNNSGNPLSWDVAGISIIGPQLAAQYGILMGVTIIADTLDVALLSLTIVEQVYQTLV
jgi:hypothetical protein